MIARRVGPYIPKKLTNEVHSPLRGEWKHVRFESRVAIAGGGYKGSIASGGRDSECVTAARDRDRSRAHGFAAL